MDLLYFIFRDGYVVKVLRESRFALSSNSVCMAKQVWFKPNTVIINHQIELSGTRVKYLDHQKRAYKHEVWSYCISEIAHSGVSRETRCLKDVRSLLQLTYFVYARSESPGEVMRTCRLVWAFATRQRNKNQHLVCWPIYSINFSLRAIICFSFSVLYFE